MGKSLKIDANYTEDVVGFAIESYLAVFSFPRYRFSIEPFSRSRERWLGADGRLISSRVRSFQPFYMQFKRPAAYPDHSSSSIIKGRKSLGLTVSPRTLHFPLRDKRPNHTDYQHNILFKLRNRLRSRNIGDAAYVCPLFLDRDAYRYHLYMSGLMHWPRFWRRHPWDWEEELLIRDNGRTIRFDRVPVLAEHVSIPPHISVTNSKHSYSFTEKGRELCFHSPEALPKGVSSFVDFLKAIVSGFLNGDGKVTSETALEELSRLIGVGTSDPLLPDTTQIFDGTDPIAGWLYWGNLLREIYDVEQYAIIAWDDDIALD